MADKINNCVECKHVNEKKNGKLMCVKHNKEVAGDGCPDFNKLQFCKTCQYAKITKYESDINDYVDYRCILQNNKLIYSDNNPNRAHNSTYPECILGMYEEN